jgi:hypothetical protein
MKIIVKISLVFVLMLCSLNPSMNVLHADNPCNAASVDGQASGIIISLNNGNKSGFIVDDVTGVISEFHYAGIEVLEINVDYIYIVQITASGKIIIRDIRRRN